MSDLPPGWAETSISDVCDPVSKWDPRATPAASFTYIDIGGIDDQQIVATKTYSGDASPSRARQIVHGGDTVLSTVRTYLRKTALVPGDLDGATASTGFCVLRPGPAIDSRFLFYRVTEHPFVAELSALQTGSSYPAVRDRDVLGQGMTLPPLAEQRRIVAAIEEQFSRLDVADTALRQVGRRIALARTALIDATFLRSWPSKPFGEVARVAGALVDPALYPDAPHIAPNHIESGTGRLLPFRTIAEDGVTSGKHRFRAGQVLYSKIRPYLKKAVVVDFDGLCSADMYPIETELEPMFLRWWMLSERFTETAIAQQGRSVLPKINREALARLPVPVPSLAEQWAVIAELEMQLSLLDSLRAAVESAQKRSAALRRSILERAFRGELVPQDPADEPASVLLERIRAERAAEPPRKRGAVRSSR